MQIDLRGKGVSKHFYFFPTREFMKLPNLYGISELRCA